MVAGLCAADGREVEKQGRKVEELGAVSQAPWAGEGFCLVSLGVDAGHPYLRMRRCWPEG